MEVQESVTAVPAETGLLVLAVKLEMVGAEPCRNVGGCIDGAEGHDFEIRSSECGEIVQIVVAPAIVGSSAEVHRRAVVGHDHAVLFEGFENDLVGGREAGDVEAGFEAQTHTHRSGELGARV